MKSGESIQQRPRGGATRCPFCHDECEAGPEVCVCADCLSRHHVSCWDEGSGCSSCRSTQRLEPVSREQTQSEGAAQVEAPRYREAIDAWLKLGLAYNVGLAAWTLLLTGDLLLTGKGLWFLADGAFLANIAFLLGPAAELGAQRAGFRNTRGFRWTLFLLGFALAGLLALGACFDFLPLPK